MFTNVLSLIDFISAGIPAVYKWLDISYKRMYEWKSN